MKWIKRLGILLILLSACNLATTFEPMSKDNPSFYFALIGFLLYILDEGGYKRND